MTQTSNDNPLNAARERLAKAFTRLENAAALLGTGNNAAREAGSALQRQVSTLAQECEKLKAEKDDFKRRYFEGEEKYKSLQVITYTISSRLDQSVRQIDEILETN